VSAKVGAKGRDRRAPAVAADLPLGAALPKLCEWTALTSVIRVVEKLRLRIRSWVTVPAISCS